MMEHLAHMAAEAESEQEAAEHFLPLVGLAAKKLLPVVARAVAPALRKALPQVARAVTRVEPPTDARDYKDCPGAASLAGNPPPASCHSLNRSPDGAQRGPAGRPGSPDNSASGGAYSGAADAACARSWSKQNPGLTAFAVDGPPFP